MPLDGQSFNLSGWQHPPCTVCGGPVARHPRERLGRWRERKTCSVQCVKSSRQGNVAEVHRLAGLGLTQPEIAEAIGDKASNVSRLARQHGIEIKRVASLGAAELDAAKRFWIERGDAALRAMVGEDARIADIALALGVSIGAVIGRKRRLGLTTEREFPSLPVRPPLVPPFPTPGHCLWMDENPRDAGAHWCGEPALLGRSYCPSHMARVYRAPAAVEIEAV